VTLKTPDPSASLVGEAGRPSVRWLEYFRSVARELTTLTSSADTLDSGKAAASQPFSEALLIETPSDKDYPFIDLNIDGTIDKVTAKTASGTCTITVKINGVAIGGSALAVTSTEAFTEHGGSNELTDGDNITVTVSSNSSATDLSISIRGTRTLA